VKGTIFPLCAAVAWVTLAYCLQGLRRDWRDPARATLCAMVALLGVAFTAAIPPVSAGLDRLVGIPNIGAFCIHVTAVASSFAVQVLLMLWACPPAQAWPRIRWRLVGLGVVLSVMTTLFVLAGVRERAPHFLLQHADHPLVAAYILFYSGSLTVGLVAITRMCWRYAAVVGSPWLRRGLRITAAGCAFTLVYCAARIADVVAALLGVDPAGWEFVVPLCAGVGTLLGFLGLTLPAWGPRLFGWVAQYRAYQQLYPLWTALYRAVPEIALHPPRSPLADRIMARDLDLRLYRRVIEIRDAQLALRGWLDRGVAESALAQGHRAGLQGAALAAFVEASQLVAALHARAAGAEAGTPTPEAAAGQGGSDLAGEIEWLVRVARAFRRVAASPAVTVVARR